MPNPAAIPPDDPPSLYDDPAAYDRWFGGDHADIAYWCDQRRRLGAVAVLELACGTGRLALPLANDGATVVGLDAVPAMLAVAKRRAAVAEAARGCLHLVAADMRRFHLRRRFDLVLIAFDSFSHLLTPADQAACLAQARLHLAPQGHLGLALYLHPPASLAEAASSNPPRRIEGGADDPVTGAPAVLYVCRRFEPATRTLTTTLTEETLRPDGQLASRTTQLRQHAFTVPELGTLLDEAGFAIVQRHGDYANGPLTDESRHAILIAQPTHDALGRQASPAPRTGVYC